MRGMDKADDDMATRLIGLAWHGAAQELLTRAHLEALYQCPLRELSVEGERWFVAGV